MKRLLINISSGLFIMAGVALAAVSAVHMMAEPVIPQKDLECLALNIYHEARGETVEGQIGVAFVTLNRVEHSNWPDNICDVVYQEKQFSWTHVIKDHTPYERKPYREALAIARDVIIGNVVDPSKGAVFYHARWVNPSWTSYVEVSKVIGNHIFYTWDGDWKPRK